MTMDSSEIRADSIRVEPAAAEGLFKASSPSKRGFAAMDASRQRDIASKGGSSVPIDKRSFSRNRELAIAAGRKGGQARMLAAQRRKLAAAAEATKANGHTYPSTPAE